MSEGFTVDGINGEIAGIVVRQAGERVFRFHASTKEFDDMDGQVFATPGAAQRAAAVFERSKLGRVRLYGFV